MVIALMTAKINDNAKGNSSSLMKNNTKYAPEVMITA